MLARNVDAAGERYETPLRPAANTSRVVQGRRTGAAAGQNEVLERCEITIHLIALGFEAFHHGRIDRRLEGAAFFLFPKKTQVAAKIEEFVLDPSQNLIDRSDEALGKGHSEGGVHLVHLPIGLDLRIVFCDPPPGAEPGGSVITRPGVDFRQPHGSILLRLPPLGGRVGYRLSLTAFGCAIVSGEGFVRAKDAQAPHAEVARGVSTLVGPRRLMQWRLKTIGERETDHTMDRETDPDLPRVRKARRGDRRAFGELVEKHQRSLTARALALTRRLEDADDLVQETFLRAWKNLRTFREDSRFGTWLFRILNNLAIDRFRVAGREVPGAEERAEAMAALDRGPDEKLLAAEIGRQVREALSAIPPGRRRDVFRLRFVEGLTIRQIAERLGVETGTIKVHIFRTHRQLRKVLDRGEVDDRETTR